MTITTQIASLPDFDQLVGEVWDSDQLICEIRQQDGVPVIEFFCKIGHVVALDDFMVAIQSLRGRSLLFDKGD